MRTLGCLVLITLLARSSEIDAELTVFVRDAAGRPLAGAEVVPAPGTGAPARTDDKGKVVLHVTPPADAHPSPPAFAWWQKLRVGATTEAVQLFLGARSETTIRMRANLLRVRLTDAAGAPHAGIAARVTPVGSEFLHLQATTDAEGGVAYYGPPGKALVIVGDWSTIVEVADGGAVVVPAAAVAGAEPPLVGSAPLRCRVVAAPEGWTVSTSVQSMGGGGTEGWLTEYLDLGPRRPFGPEGRFEAREGFVLWSPEGFPRLYTARPGPVPREFAIHLPPPRLRRSLQVVDLEGRPFAGLTLRLSGWSLPSGEMVLEGDRPTFVTDEKGRVDLPLALQLAPPAGWHVHEREWNRLVLARDRAVAVAHRRVLVRIVDPDGAFIPNAWVRTAGAETFRDRRGCHLFLPPGAASLDVRISADGWSDLVLSGIDVDRNLTLKMPAANRLPPLALRLLDPVGEPVPGVRVTAEGVLRETDAEGWSRMPYAALRGGISLYRRGGLPGWTRPLRFDSKRELVVLLRKGGRVTLRLPAIYGPRLQLVGEGPPVPLRVVDALTLRADHVPPGSYGVQALDYDWQAARRLDMEPFDVAEGENVLLDLRKHRALLPQQPPRRTLEVHCSHPGADLFLFVNGEFGYRELTDHAGRATLLVRPDENHMVVARRPGVGFVAAAIAGGGRVRLELRPVRTLVVRSPQPVQIRLAGLGEAHRRALGRALGLLPLSMFAMRSPTDFQPLQRAAEREWFLPDVPVGTICDLRTNESNAETHRIEITAGDGPQTARIG